MANYINKLKIKNTQYTVQDYRINDIDSQVIENSTNPITSGAVYELKSNLEEAIENVVSDTSEIESKLSETEENISDINDKIPAAASESNQLADKAFVTNSISTASATFKGTSAENLTEGQFLVWANTLDADLNDYVYWNTKDSNRNVVYKRYKYDGASWIFEYAINSSSFNSDEWAAIQSGVTSSLVEKLNGINAGAQVNVIETIQQNGTDLPITNKRINITVPTSLSELSADSTHTFVSNAEKTTWNNKQSEISVLDDMLVIP